MLAEISAGRPHADTTCGQIGRFRATLRSETRSKPRAMRACTARGPPPKLVPRIDPRSTQSVLSRSAPDGVILRWARGSLGEVEGPRDVSQPWFEEQKQIWRSCATRVVARLQD